MLEIRGTSSVHAIHIRSRALEGELTFADGVGTGKLIVPTKSLHGDTPLHDIELRRKIPPRRFPAIEATVTRLTTTEAAGEIAFFGATQAASGPITVEEVDDELVITGEANFDVRDFGFQPPNILGVRVHPEIVVHVEIRATPRPHR